MTLASNDIWKLLAGLGLFLYGMFHLEESIKNLEGRSFKLFLQKHTKKKLSAILSGTLVTAILQSSSIVNLIVLSFVGAGMLSMRNAISVALGANIGGTFNSWLVAILGFKVNLDSYTLPIVAICGIGLVLFNKHKQLRLISRIGMGIGLLFLGLGFMKESMELLLQNFDFKPYLDKPRVVFVLIGFVITALVQTSSATVVLALSALYTQIIPIETAVAVIIGAEFGTTIKLLLGSIGGIAAKQKVAVANILFNLITSVYGFLLIGPIIHFLSGVIGIHDPIYILVSFQTFLNISGVILVFFFLDTFADFLDRRFTEQTTTSTYFLETTSPEITDSALQMIDKEVSLFVYRVLKFNLDIIGASYADWPDNDFKKILLTKKKINGEHGYKENYNFLKQAEGEILAFYAQLSLTTLEESSQLHLNQVMASLRNAMYSAKGMKDIFEDIKNLSNSSNTIKYEAFLKMQAYLTNIYKDLSDVLVQDTKVEAFEILTRNLNAIKQEYEDWSNTFILQAGDKRFKELDISTLINLNREVYSSTKAIILSLKDLLLDKDNADNFENMSGLKLK